MEKISRIVTLVAGLGLVGALSCAAGSAWGADRPPADPTRLDPNYWSSAREQRQGQDEAVERDPHARYHADYHVKTGSEPVEPPAEDPRDARRRQEWPMWRERSMPPPLWRR